MTNTSTVKRKYILSLSIMNRIKNKIPCLSSTLDEYKGFLSALNVYPEPNEGIQIKYNGLICDVLEFDVSSSDTLKNLDKTIINTYSLFYDKLIFLDNGVIVVNINAANRYDFIKNIILTVLFIFTQYVFAQMLIDGCNNHISIYEKIYIIFVTLLNI